MKYVVFFSLKRFHSLEYFLVCCEGVTPQYMCRHISYAYKYVSVFKTCIWTLLMKFLDIWTIWSHLPSLCFIFLFYIYLHLYILTKHYGAIIVFPYSTCYFRFIVLRICKNIPSISLNLLYVIFIQNPINLSYYTVVMLPLLFCAELGMQMLLNSKQHA